MEIVLNANSTLKIKSYTLFKNVFEKDSIVSCEVKVLRKKGRKLKIEEIGASSSDTLGLQIMSLTYKEKEGYEYLEGRWYSKENRHFLMRTGSISLVKIKNNKDNSN